MNIATLLHGFGSIGMFTSRAFLPAFITAFLLRFGDSLPYLKDADLFQATIDDPTWFTHWITLTILGILAALEVAATKIPEAQEVLNDIHAYFKSSMAALSFMGIISVSDMDFIRKTIQEAGLGQISIAGIIAAMVYGLDVVRSQLLQFLIESDADDDLGVRGFISWIEDLFSISFVALLLLFPIVALAINLLIVAGLFLVRRHLEKKEEKTRIPCVSCGEMVYQCAIQCQKCATPLAQPHAIGFLGQSKPYPSKSIQNQPFRLAEERRCPVCATRIKEKSIHPTCTACGHTLFKKSSFNESYLEHIARRLPMVCGLSFLMSLIPVIGLIPGVIYYRLALVAPFRRYIPMTHNFVAKWSIRLLFFALVSMQIVPGLGGFVVPIMAMVSFLVYRTTFCKMLNIDPAAAKDN